MLMVLLRPFSENKNSEPGFFWAALCDFIEGEARNLRKGERILEESEAPRILGILF